MHPSDFDCPVNAALSVIRGKWKPAILWQLTAGAARFGDLQASLPGITHKVLSEQLAQLRSDGLIEHGTSSATEPMARYALTPLGGSLRPALNALANWGKQQAASQSAKRSGDLSDGADQEVGLLPAVLRSRSRKRS